MMNIVHDSHPGMVRMKGIARSHVWWPKMDQALEERAKSCKTCQEQRKTPATAALHPWEWPSYPWSRIHIDYAGPFMGKMFPIIIDAHSKWLDVHCVNTATAETTITKLRSTFATHGLLEIIVSDNGTVFTSHEFKRDTCTATVGEFIQNTHGSIETECGIKGSDGQTQQKSRHDQHSRPQSFPVGDNVYARNYNGNGKWIPGTIVEVMGPVSVKAELENGITIRRHHDQIVTWNTVVPVLASPSIMDQEHLQQEVEPPEEDLEQIRKLVWNYPARLRGPPDCFE